MIRPCPICGDPAAVKSSPGSGGFNDTPPTWWVECSGCKTRTRPFSEYEGTQDQCQAWCIQQWNIRKDAP